MHARAQVLDYVRTALLGVSPFGANVFHEADHPHPMAGAELPGVRIDDAGDESIEVECIGFPRQELRTMRFVLLCAAAEKTGLRAKLDAMEVAAEKTLNASSAAYNAGGLLVEGFEKISSDVVIGNDGDRPRGTVTLEYRARYSVLSSAPDNPI